MTLASYILIAMLSWTRPHGHARDDADLARLQAIAEDISSVVRQEDPLFRDDPLRARTALVVASVARFESAFEPWVDDGRCNDAVWRATSVGIHHGADCDGGHAFSLWQIHPYGPISGVALIADRRAAIREAIARMRVSLDAGRGLCWYTGESGDCPKAEIRLRTALVYEKGHPFKALE